MFNIEQLRKDKNNKNLNFTSNVWKKHIQIFSNIF